MAGRVRRVRRRLRGLFERLTPLQWAVVALMGVFLCVGVGAVTYIADGTPAVRALPQSAPPLTLETPQASGATASVTPSVPDTIRLLIPSQGIDLQVIQGDGVRVPLHLAMHYPGTSQPGAGSNSLYYAHGQPGMFQGLYNLHPGDEIRTMRADGSQLVYRVSGFRKVPFNDRSVVQPTPFEQLTLLTCTSYDPYTARFIVIATPE